MWGRGYTTLAIPLASRLGNRIRSSFAAPIEHQWKIKYYNLLGDSGIANLSSNRPDASQALRNPLRGLSLRCCGGDEITYWGVDALLSNCFTKWKTFLVRYGTSWITFGWVQNRQDETWDATRIKRILFLNLSQM